jgi:hypothetical protein
MKKSPEKELEKFIAKYSPEVCAVAQEALSHLRERLPGAIELVYDNYNALAISFGPTERASDAILSIALYPRWVNLFFLEGAKLPDPHKLLQGSGSRVRRIRLEDAATLRKPAVRALITQALKLATRPIDPSGRRRIIIKMALPKQRPRRPGRRDQNLKVSLVSERRMGHRPRSK